VWVYKVVKTEWRGLCGVSEKSEDGSEPNCAGDGRWGGDSNLAPEVICGRMHQLQPPVGGAKRPVCACGGARR
jgi:hypothetical protein